MTVETSSLKPQEKHLPPLVSILCIAYNNEPYIADTLASIVSQGTNFPFEIIVHDDASTDKTPGVIKHFAEQYPSLIRPIYQTQNQLSQGKKCSPIALEYARGQYIAHLDGDDLMLPGKLQRQVDFLNAHPECSMCCHRMKVLDPSGQLKSSKKRWAKKINTVNDLLMHHSFFAHSSKMFRKSAIPTGGLDSSPHIVADYLWHMQNVEFGSIGYIDEELGIYRVGNGLIEAMKRDKRKITLSVEDRLKALQYGLKIGGNKIAFSIGLARLWFSACRDYIRIKDYKDCISCLFLILRGVK